MRYYIYCFEPGASLSSVAGVDYEFDKLKLYNGLNIEIVIAERVVSLSVELFSDETLLIN